MDWMDQEQLDSEYKIIIFSNDFPQKYLIIIFKITFVINNNSSWCSGL